ncbi:MAG TPA: TIGR03435 family protein [Bryobacteraceae bacterium]|jgi:uncharacterized protein (TIGR03435 family)
MQRALARISFIALLSSTAFGQAPGAQKAEALPTFDIADVHASPRTVRAVLQTGMLRAGRYQLLNATMVDLIRTAYNVDADKILGGPSWLEQDRFDVIAKAPQSTSPEALKLMLQSLLAGRFKLVFRSDTHPLPAFSLTVAKGGPKLKEADGSAEPGCRFTADTAAQIDKAQAQIAAARAASDSGTAPVAISLRPTYTYTCGSTTMAAFAEAMHTMPVAASYFGTGIIVDQTGLKGAWDFSFKYTAKPPTSAAAANAAASNVINIGGDSIPLFEAVEKQIGLKLDPITFATPVIIVESVKRKPTDNPPDITTALLPPPAAEFEVADLRLSEPGAPAVPSPGFQPSGRVDLRNYPLRSMINLALNINVLDGPALTGDPKWLAAARVDLVAKMPLTDGPIPAPAVDAFRPALLALLKDRFKFAYHLEERPADAFALTAAKPKLKKTADPLIRTNCKEGPGADGKDPRIANPVNGRLITCVNTTMEQFAEQLPRLASGYIRSEVLDATGIDGAYDFTLNFAAAGAAAGGGGRGGDVAALGAPGASDPNGATSLFDALTKQLGLKLETQKRPMPFIVIDHLDPKPTDN